MTTPPGGQPPSEPDQPYGQPQQPPYQPDQPYGQPQQPPYQPDQPYGQPQQPPYQPDQPYAQPPYSGPGGYAQPAPPLQPGYGYQAPDHPRATTSLVLGILGVVLCPLIGPFAWSVSKKAREEIDAAGGQLGGRGQVQAGYILGIVGSALLALYLVLFVIWLAFVLLAIGGAVSTSP